MTRQRRWIVALGIALAVRMALPSILRPVLASQAAKALNAQVEIGDVDLWLMRGAIALEDVSVRSAAAPGALSAPAEKNDAPVPEATEAPASDTTTAAEAEPPLVAWKRLALNLAWFPLLRKTVRLESVQLDEPRVALDRLANGEINLMALVPKGEATPTAAASPLAEEPATSPTPAPALPDARAGGPTPVVEQTTGPAPSSGWGIGIDHLILAGGHVRFRDLALRDAEPVDVALPTITLRDLALQPGLYGGPAHAQLDVRVDKGRLRVKTSVRLLENGLAATTNVRASRLPLRRTRLYVPQRGWRELVGDFGARLVHRFESGGRHDLRGAITLDGVVVRIPGVEHPVLEWAHLGVAVDPIDLVAQRAAVTSVELTGARVLARSRGALLPVYEAPSAGPSEPGGKPWHWSVAALKVSDSHVSMLATDPPTDLGVELDAHTLSGDSETPAPVRLALRLGDGSLGLAGDLRIAQPGFSGTLTLDNLPLTELVGVSGRLPPSVLQKGVLGAELALAAGSSAPTPGDLRMQGKITVTDPWMAAADPWEFALGWSALEVGIDELLIPGALAAKTQPSSAGAPARPIAVRLASIDLAKPYVQLTRTNDGIVLPPLTLPAEGQSASAASTPASAAATTPAPGDAAATRAPSATAIPATAAPATSDTTAPAAGERPPPPFVDVTVETLRVTQGNLLVTDRTVKPFFTGGLAPLDVDVQKLRWPELAMEKVRVEATSTTRGKLLATGGFSPTAGDFEVTGKSIALQPFNPYATAYSPYSIAKGALTVTTKGRFRKGNYDSTTALELEKFDLGGKEGDTLFAKQFGIPISVALALLTDFQGNIGLDIPVAGDAKGTKVGVTTVVGQALRKALVGALASPLKLVGAVFAGGEGEAVAPAPIAFRPGRADLTQDGEKQVEGLAGFLAGRPGIGLVLQAAPSAEDVRWLREHALYEDLAAPQGVLGAVRNLPQRGARDRIRTALEARAQDEKGELDPGDTDTLEQWLAERPAPTADQLKALGGERMDRIQALLRERHGIGPERVGRHDAVAEVAEGAPNVRFEIGAAGGSS